MLRVRFAGVRRVSDRGLTGGFWLKRRIDNPRLKIESYTARDFGHIFRVSAPEELDDELFAWITEAYEIGEQRWLYGRSPDPA